jgi:hypothetical protein
MFGIGAAVKIVRGVKRTNELPQLIQKNEQEINKHILQNYQGVRRYEIAERLLDAILIQQIIQQPYHSEHFKKNYILNLKKEFTMAQYELSKQNATREDIAKITIALREVALSLDESIKLFNIKSQQELISNNEIFNQEIKNQTDIFNQNLKQSENNINKNLKSLDEAYLKLNKSIESFNIKSQQELISNNEKFNREIKNWESKIIEFIESKEEKINQNIQINITKESIKYKKTLTIALILSIIGNILSLLSLFF